MPDTKSTLLVQHNSGVVTLTIDRPHVRNAVDADTMLQLREAMTAACKLPDTRVFVITGTGGAFSAGADIQMALQHGITPLEAQEILNKAYAPAILGIWECPWPVIAAVDGMAAGIGCDLTLACDMRLVSERGAFAELFIRVGLIPDGGGSYLLPRLVGLGRAFEMIAMGETINARDAYAIGLANKVFPTETFYHEVTTYAERLAQQAPLALVRAKQALHAALQGGNLKEAMSREAVWQREIFESEDGFEGFRAFLEKRSPQWKGR